MQGDLSQHREVVSPPSLLTFSSMADLLEQYENLLVRRVLRDPRGIQVVFEPVHFFHLVKLRKGFQTKFLMSEERDRLLATNVGFGEYEIDLRRAQSLSWIPDLVEKPHEIYEYFEKRTADEVFVKEYEKSGSPFKVLLVVREEDYLRPVTSMTVRRPGIKEHRRGRLLWSKKENRPG